MAKAVKGQDKEQKTRGDRFFGAFLFTENGRPKSSLILYTFCLSFVFLGVYVASFYWVIDTTTAPLAGLPVAVANAVQALAASALAVGALCLLHLLVKDKRLVLGGHLWLLLYALLVLLIMLAMMWDTGAASTFLVFYGWFVAIPLALGLVVSWLLYRRDHHPRPAAQPEPDWKKYIDRR